MKLNKLLTIAYIGIATIGTSSVVNAMDAEFALYNHQKAQVMGTKYKRDLAHEKTLRLGGGGPAALNDPAAEDTLDLLKAASGDVAALNAVKGRIVIALKAKANDFFDDFGGGGNPVLNLAATNFFGAAEHARLDAIEIAAGRAALLAYVPAVGGGEMTRDALKALVDAVIDNATVAAIIAPVDGSIEAISATKSAIANALSVAGQAVIDSLEANDVDEVISVVATNLVGAAEHARLNAIELAAGRPALPAYVPVLAGMTRDELKVAFGMAVVL